jgi:[acyl-carrier-protein] S-malonyltransferase
MFEFVRRDPRTHALLDRWPLADLLGMPVDAALADPATLFANRAAQPLIVAAALASWHAIRELVPTPALVAGYSAGELTAYGVADALPAAEAIRLAACRAHVMDECARASGPSGQQILVAVSGLRTRVVRDLLPREALFIAIETGPDSVIVGGSRARAAALEHEVRRLGGRTRVLPVEVASHTPFMRAAAARFGAELQRGAFASPAIPVLAGISAQAIRQRDDALLTLARQVAEPVKWMDCMDACAEAGVTLALELLPGTALSRMFRERHPHIECRALADFRTAAGVATWISNHGG